MATEFKEGARFFYKGIEYIIVSFTREGNIIHAKCEKEYPNRFDERYIYLDIEVERNDSH